MAGLFDPKLKELLEGPPLPQVFDIFPDPSPSGEANPVLPKVPGSRDRNRIDPDRRFRAPLLIKV